MKSRLLETETAVWGPSNRITSYIASVKYGTRWAGVMTVPFASSHSLAEAVVADHDGEQGPWEAGVAGHRRGTGGHLDEGSGAELGERPVDARSAVASLGVVR